MSNNLIQQIANTNQDKYFTITYTNIKALQFSRKPKPKWMPRFIYNYILSFFIFNDYK